MPPKRKAGNERAELMAVLTCLITMYVEHGVPPSIPELAGNGRTETHAIFQRPGRDGATPWGVELLQSLMAASAEARALNGEEALSEATFLGKLLGDLKKRSPPGDAAAFRDMAAEYGLALTASALAASALATWRNALHPLCPSPARRRTPCPCISAPAPALTRLALLGQLTPARARSGRLRP